MKPLLIGLVALGFYYTLGFGAMVFYLGIALLAWINESKVD